MYTNKYAHSLDEFCLLLRLGVCVYVFCFSPVFHCAEFLFLGRATYARDIAVLVRGRACVEHLKPADVPYHRSYPHLQHVRPGCASDLAVEELP